MSNSLEKIKNICNFGEKNVGKSQTQLYYVNFTEITEEIQNTIKSHNRNLACELVLDGDVEKYENNLIKSVEKFDESNTFNNLSGLGNFSTPSIYSISMDSNNFTDYDDLYDSIVKFLDTNTNKSKVTKNPHLMSLIKTSLKKSENGETPSEVYQHNLRNLIAQIMFCSNIISLEGRIGPANSVLIGRNLHYYFNEDDEFLNLKLIFDYNMDPDKIIVCKSNNIDQNGLIVIDDSKNNNYFMKETFGWEKQYCWFWVK